MMRTSSLVLALSAALFGIAVNARPEARSPLPDAEVSGTLRTARKVVAAMVNLRNIDKNIVYTVFTQNGRYAAPHLFPGRYEIWIDENGLSDARTPIVVRDHQRQVLDLSPAVVPIRDRYVGARYSPDRLVQRYDAIYPTGPARTTIERTCQTCHGVNFLPGSPKDRAGWETALDYMMLGSAFGHPDAGPFIAPGRISARQRAELLDYLVANFGADKAKRVVKEEQPVPRDEAVLGKAMFMEYQFAPAAKDPMRYIQEIAFDHQGTVWATQTLTYGELVHLDPTTGTFKEYKTPNPRWGPHGIIIDNDDTVWAAGMQFGLIHFDEKANNWDLYPAAKGHHSLSPFFDSKGNIYFTSLPGNQLGRWDRRTDAITRWEAPSRVASPYGLVIDSHDTVWFNEFHTCKLARFDPDTTQFTEYSAVSQPCTTRRPGLDATGNLWFGIHSGGKIENLDVATGKIRVFDIPVQYASPYDTWIAADGNVWSSNDNFILRLEPKSGKMDYYPTFRQGDEPKISITRDGAIWFPPRGSAASMGGPPAVDVLYPDKDAITSFASYYAQTDPNVVNIAKYKGPPKAVTGTGNDGGAKLAEQAGDPEARRAGD